VCLFEVNCPAKKQNLRTPKDTKFPIEANCEYETLPSDSLCSKREFDASCKGKVLLGTPEIRKSLKGDLGCMLPDGGGFTRAAVHRLGADGYGLGADGYGLGADGYGLGADGYGLGADGYGLNVATCRQTVDTHLGAFFLVILENSVLPGSARFACTQSVRSLCR
jgi:hypothetical protein